MYVCELAERVLVRRGGGREGTGQGVGRGAEDDGLAIRGAKGARALRERGEEVDGFVVARLEDDGTVERRREEQNDLACAPEA